MDEGDYVLVAAADAEEALAYMVESLAVRAETLALGLIGLA